MKTYMNLFKLTVCLAVLMMTSVSCAETQEHLNGIRYLEEKEKVAAATILLNNSGKTVPLKKTEKGKIVSINIDSEYSAAFNDMLKRYAPVSDMSLPVENFSRGNIKQLTKKIKKYDTVIIQTTDKPLLEPAVLEFIKVNEKKHHMVLRVTGGREILKNLGGIKSPVIISDINSEISAGFSAQLIFGGVGISSRLESDISGSFPKGAGDTVIPVRLEYTVPEETGINGGDLLGIDDIVNEAINLKAAPGAVVMIVRDGKVIFEKSYGHHTYDGGEPVKTTDIYDLASITKAAATTLAVMKLQEQGRIKLDNKISSYIGEARRTDKGKITVRDLMLHKSGLAPSIDFSRKVKSGDRRSRYSSSYNVRVADNCYLRKGYYKNNMWPQILKSRLGARGNYLYSDLGMFFVKEMIERRSGKSFENYLHNSFYKPLGMQTAGFNPRDKFPAERLVPTEVDSYFRNSTLLGYVHDLGAAMTGGVAGHAGLFSDANDLAILFQMLLNRGSYGGVEYFKGETVDMFTSKTSDRDRRTLGFDGWDPESKDGFPSSLAPRSVFGHTGFTGTCVWADPENRLIYIFLSNRTYPNTGNKLAKMNVRSRILDVIYSAMKKE